MKDTTFHKIVFLAFIVSLAVGFFAERVYFNSKNQAVNLNHFQKVIDSKINEANNGLSILNDIVIGNKKDTSQFAKNGDKGISYYIFQDDKLTFWTDNHFDISTIDECEETNWKYIELTNAQGIYKVVHHDSFQLLSFIKIKHNYPYENEKLVNRFNKEFNTDKQVKILTGNINDENAITNTDNEYLFTLSSGDLDIYDETWSQIALIAFAISVLMFFILYARSPLILDQRIIGTKHFFAITISVGLITFLCLYFNFPRSLYWNNTFTPYQYASNPILATISHLTVISQYVNATIIILFFHVKNTRSRKSIKNIVLQFGLGAYFLAMYYIFSGIVKHSSINLSLVDVENINFIVISIYLLLLVWGICFVFLFLKSHFQLYSKKDYFIAIKVDILTIIALYIFSSFLFPDDIKRIVISYTAFLAVLYLLITIKYFRKKPFIYLTIVTFVYTIFMTWNGIELDKEKKAAKYKVLAQNIMVNGDAGIDRFTELLLEDLDLQLKKDKTIAHTIHTASASEELNQYINDTYLRGYWNNYEMRLYVLSKGSALYDQYERIINFNSSRVFNTNFYSVPSIYHEMSIIGVYDVKSDTDTLSYFMEFYPRKNFKSYSFPDLLISSNPDIQTRLNIAIAKYEGGHLIHSSGNFTFPEEKKCNLKNGSDFGTFENNNMVFYTYEPNKENCVIITELKESSKSDTLFNIVYTYFTYLLLCWIILWLYLAANNQIRIKFGLAAKFQFSFIVLLLISFAGTFYVSSNFIMNKYKNEQINNLANKKRFIQKALQNTYYWTNDLSTVSTQRLNFDLQELQYTFQSDIHVYNNEGKLVGSSQPILFNKGLISNRISPEPYFAQNANMNQNEYIGELDYLTAYTDFYNGDYLQIGYIAIPQYLSQEEIRNEIKELLGVILNIYFIIFIISFLISLMINQQLSAPLILIENKLKQMQFGRKNEKIEYEVNDEIGQLVAQYNKTIDELERSAALLAQSERETAWKTMARQIAHEINNPLTPMKLTIQQMQRTHETNKEKFEEYFDRSAHTLIEQIDNLSKIAGTFSNFAKMPDAQLTEVDIAAKLHSVYQLFCNNHENVLVRYNGSIKDIHVIADPEQLVQVFNNLIKNAIQSIPEERDGEVNIGIDTSFSQVFVHITDNGTGISDEIKDKLYRPNFTTKRKGMGLGLGITKNIIEMLGGSITFETKENEGTTFTIALPLKKSMLTN